MIGWDRGKLRGGLEGSESCQSVKYGHESRGNWNQEPPKSKRDKAGGKNVSFEQDILIEHTRKRSLSHL
jgi:hypothetical protein